MTQLQTEQRVVKVPEGTWKVDPGLLAGEEVEVLLDVSADRES
jgi:hypothetical protein